MEVGLIGFWVSAALQQLWCVCCTRRKAVRFF